MLAPLYFLAYSLEMLVSLTFFGIFSLMFGLLFIGWLLAGKPPKPALSPYTGLPLRPLTDLSYKSVAKVMVYLERYPGYDNKMFNIFTAAVCRETGRVFPNAITWWGKIKVDWGFIQKRYSGNYVSWGSLGEDQQREIREAHTSLEGFQTDYSSLNQLPRDIEKQFSYLKPGPLYVNLETKELVGWKCVPDSDLEVLIVQKPKEKILAQ